MLRSRSLPPCAAPPPRTALPATPAAAATKIARLASLRARQPPLKPPGKLIRQDVLRLSPLWERRPPNPAELLFGAVHRHPTLDTRQINTLVSLAGLIRILTALSASPKFCEDSYELSHTILFLITLSTICYA